MKILFVLGFPNPFTGAAWTRIGFLAEEWSKKGFCIDILGTFTPKNLPQRGSNLFCRKTSLFNVIPNIYLENHPIGFIINFLAAFLASTLFLIGKRPNIAIVSVPTGDVGLGALMACRLARIKYIVDYRDEWEDYAKSSVDRKSEKAFYCMVSNIALNLYHRSNFVTAVTSKIMRILNQRGLSNVTLVPNGADSKLFKPSSQKDCEFELIYSGGLGDYYRLDVVLRAMRRFIEKGPKNVKLIIAGDGAIHELIVMASRLGISRNVSYMGAIIKKTKLADIIAKANVGLIPYDNNPLWKNTLPAKFFEYCACGLPVIATAYEDSLLAEFIKEYEIGMTSPPMNEEKLAESFYRLYENKDFTNAAGKRARTLIEERFDRNKIAEEFLKLIKA